MSENFDSIASEVTKTEIPEFLANNYLPYSHYAIRHRALVDSDGFKPVNRRILYTLFNKNITPSAQHMKAARVSGLVTALHPHGNSSVEDALARMAQKFSMRVPLVDAHGSVGFVQGDTAAAPRYWEARLTPAAMELLNEIDLGGTEIVPNFDGTETEPILFPVRFPNGLINGSSGIAVGFAAEIPPHNPTETLKACRAILRDPELSVDKLLKIMPGPDFPTGGEVVGQAGIRDYYESGRGTFLLRGKYTIEQGNRGKVKIFFNELPYGISPEKVMFKIRDLQNSGKLTDIVSVTDLTDRKHGLRLMLETKAGSNYLAVINDVFKLTPAQVSFNVNNTVLNDGVPEVLSVPQLLQQFIDLRKLSVIRQTKFRLGKVDSRLYQIAGLLLVLVDIDKAIAIIRKSDTPDIAKTGLCKAFKIDEKQAETILGMTLRKLTKSDSLALKAEEKSLQEEKTALSKLLNNYDALLDRIDADLLSTMKIIDDKRRTAISNVTVDELAAEVKTVTEAVKAETKNVDCWISRFADGGLAKTLQPFVYPAAGLLKYTPIVEQFKVKTQDFVVLITASGKGIRIPVSYIPYDTPIHVSKCGIPSGEKFVGVSKNVSLRGETGLAIMTRLGQVKITKTDFPKTDSFPVVFLEEKDEIVDCRWVGEPLSALEFLSFSRNGQVLRFEAANVRPSGSRAGGVKGHGLADGDHVVGFSLINKKHANSVLVLTKTPQTLKISPYTEFPVKGRGTMGVMGHGFRKGEPCQLVYAAAYPDLVATIDTGNVLNMPPLCKRAAAGTNFGIPNIYAGVIS